MLAGGDQRQDDATQGAATVTTPDDAELAAEISAAIKELDAADSVKKEKQLIAGRLLAEAQKRHPTDKAFTEFLKLAGGIQIRRARDLIALALGRKDYETHQSENKEAQQRHRDKLKSEREAAEAEALREAAAAAAAEVTALRNAPKSEPAQPKPAPEPPPSSATCLRKFKAACRDYLPNMVKSDFIEARAYFTLRKWAADIDRREAAAKRKKA